MSYGYSAKTNIFYVLEDQEAYESNNNWPDDVQPVELDNWEEYCKQPPLGKIRGADAAGLPCWMDAPPLSHPECVLEATRKKNRLITQAGIAIAPLQDAADLEMATQEESTQLLAWRRYRVQLNRIDVDQGNAIIWPEVPNVA